MRKIGESLKGLQDSKSAIRNSIIGKNVGVPETAKYETFSGYIDQIKLAPPNAVDTSDATALPTHIRLGYTAYARGAKIVGTMATYAGSTAVTPNYSTQYLRTTGMYMNSDITIYPQTSYPSGTDTSDGTAYSNHILKDKTAYARGGKLTGTIETYTGSTVSAGSTIPTGGKYCQYDITGTGGGFNSIKRFGQEAYVNYTGDAYYTITLGWTPAMIYGYAHLGSNNDRMFGWCDFTASHEGIFDRSDGGIDPKTFYPYPTSIMFIPNGSKGTMKYWVVGY